MKTTNNKRQMTNNERGVTLYLAMLVMSAALATALFVSSVFVREFKISKEIVDSLRAVYAADTAMEYALYQMRTPSAVNATTLSNLGFVQTTGGTNADNRLLGVSSAATPAYYYLSSTLCSGKLSAASVATSGAHTCDMKIVLDVDKTKNVNGCPLTSAALNCTLIDARGSYGSINRAMEIVYENL